MIDLISNHLDTNISSPTITGNGTSTKKNTRTKVRLTNVNIAVGNIEKATERMNKQNGALVKHMGRENGRMEWRMLEGVETIK